MTHDESASFARLAGFTRNEWIAAYCVAGCDRERAQHIVDELFSTWRRLPELERFPMTPQLLLHFAHASAQGRATVGKFLAELDIVSRAALLDRAPELRQLLSDVIDKA